MGVDHWLFRALFLTVCLAMGDGLGLDTDQALGVAATG